ncbi:MAG: 2-isopropylmalate synthase [Puniceicoccales bacterium]|jgi:2-isopropylmalate synthase|nr:2-isopropylmalate synthase [Puniceicoccales bacterium]
MQRAPITKYHAFPAIPLKDRQWPDKTITAAPVWCSVDLRDGNQALAIPMNVREKLEMFQLLVRLGFKEIEIGFPSASDTEFAFCRELIEHKLIPDDVSVQVLVQCREHLLLRTFEALKGARRPILHLYNSTSPLQRRVTFGNASKADIKKIATDATRIVKALAHQLPDMRLQYSPESFSDTEVEFSLEICEAVMEIWQPSQSDPVILNLPETVQWTTPNVYADQIEWFCRHLSERDKAIISLHTHNDRGTGVAATELGLMAGAQRVEGTLFGNGERTGNLDIVTVALNLYAHGIDPGLAFDDLAAIRQTYERCTRMPVPARHPYGGDLVFTAFSGSHQDAIKKGMDLREGAPADTPWAVPYLTIDPRDIGCTYEAIIRINSQSGKGGVAYVLDREFGLDLPKAMHPQVGDTMNTIADAAQRELSPKEIYQHFRERFANLGSPLKVESFEHRAVGDGGHTLEVVADVVCDGEAHTLTGLGNGPLNAFVNALETQGWKNFTLKDYRSHAIGTGSATDSAAYVAIEREADKSLFWGCGIDSNIETAGLYALISAFNRARTEKH